MKNLDRGLQLESCIGIQRLTKQALENIKKQFGVDALENLLEDADVRYQLNDSVQDLYCLRCGEQGDSVEPDGTCSCDFCGGRCVSLEMLVLGL